MILTSTFLASRYAQVKITELGSCFVVWSQTAAISASKPSMREWGMGYEKGDRRYVVPRTAACTVTREILLKAVLTSQTIVEVRIGQVAEYLMPVCGAFQRQGPSAPMASSILELP